MAIKMSQFLNPNGFSVIVHFPTKLKMIDPSISSGYVVDSFYKSKSRVLSYLKKKTNFSEDRILKSLKMVQFHSSKIHNQLCVLTKVEAKKVQLAHLLLQGSKVIICEHFFEGLIYAEREYFKRLFRNLMFKQDKSIILLENDMNFVCETVKQFYLFTEKENYKLISDFYDEEIYQYVLMSHTISLVKYLESCGHSIDHDITFLETLKGIYRGVK